MRDSRTLIAGLALVALGLTMLSVPFLIEGNFYLGPVFCNFLIRNITCDLTLFDHSMGFAYQKWTMFRMAGWFEPVMHGLHSR